MSSPLNSSKQPSTNVALYSNVSVVLPGNSTINLSTLPEIDKETKSQLTDLLAQFGKICSKFVILDGRKNVELSQNTSNIRSKLIKKLLSSLEQAANLTQQYEIPHQTSATNNDMQDLTGLNQGELNFIFGGSGGCDLMHTKTSLVIVEVYVEGQKKPIYMLIENRDKSVMVSPQKRRVENQIKSLINLIRTGENGGIIPDTNLSNLFHYSVSHSNNDILVGQINNLVKSPNLHDTNENTIKSAVKLIIGSKNLKHIESLTTRQLSKYTEIDPDHESDNLDISFDDDRTNKRKRSDQTIVSNSSKKSRTSSSNTRRQASAKQHTPTVTTTVSHQEMFLDIISKPVVSFRNFNINMTGNCITINKVDMACKIFNALYDKYRHEYQENHDYNEFVQNVTNLCNKFHGELTNNLPHIQKLDEILKYMLEKCNSYNYIEMSTSSHSNILDKISQQLEPSTQGVPNTETMQENMVITSKECINIVLSAEEIITVFNQLHYAVTKIGNNYILWHINSDQNIKGYKISDRVGQALQNKTGATFMEIICKKSSKLFENVELFQDSINNMFNLYITFVPKLMCCPKLILQDTELIVKYDYVFFMLGNICLTNVQQQKQLKQAYNYKHSIPPYNHNQYLSLELNYILLTSNTTDLVFTTMMDDILGEQPILIDKLFDQNHFPDTDIIDAVIKVGLNCSLGTLAKYIDPVVIKKAMSYLSWVSVNSSATIVRVFMAVLHSYNLKLIKQSETEILQNKDQFQPVIQAIDTIVSMILKFNRQPLYVPGQDNAYSSLSHNVIKYNRENKTVGLSYYNKSGQVYYTTLNFAHGVSDDKRNDFFNGLMPLSKCSDTSIFSDYNYESSNTTYLKDVLQKIFSEIRVDNVLLNTFQLNFVFFLLVLDKLAKINSSNENTASMHTNEAIYIILIDDRIMPNLHGSNNYNPLLSEIVYKVLSTTQSVKRFSTLLNKFSALITDEQFKKIHRGYLTNFSKNLELVNILENHMVYRGEQILQYLKSAKGDEYLLTLILNKLTVANSVEDLGNSHSTIKKIELLLMSVPMGYLKPEHILALYDNYSRNNPRLKQNLEFNSIMYFLKQALIEENASLDNMAVSNPLFDLLMKDNVVSNITDLIEILVIKKFSYFISDEQVMDLYDQYLNASVINSNLLVVVQILEFYMLARNDKLHKKLIDNDNFKLESFIKDIVTSKRPVIIAELITKFLRLPSSENTSLSSMRIHKSELVTYIKNKPVEEIEDIMVELLTICSKELVGEAFTLFRGLIGKQTAIRLQTSNNHNYLEFINFMRNSKNSSTIQSSNRLPATSTGINDANTTLVTLEKKLSDIWNASNVDTDRLIALDNLIRAEADNYENLKTIKQFLESITNTATDREKAKILDFIRYINTRLSELSSLLT